MVWQEAQRKLEENTQHGDEQLPEPTIVTEIDDMFDVGPGYDPLTDTLSVPDDQEETGPVETRLIVKYAADQLVGDTGKQTIRELNQQIPTYQEIKNGDILKAEPTTFATQEEMDEQFREVFGEEPPESRLDTDINPNELMERGRDTRFRRLQNQLGTNEELHERLATLQLSDQFTETITQYQTEYQQLEQEKEQAWDEFSQFEDQYWDELEQTLSEDALEDLVELEVQEMETQMEVFDRTEEAKTDMEKIKELEAGVDPTEILEDTGNYQKEDVAEILKDHGYGEHTDRVYELMQERQQREAEKDQRIDQLGDRQLELSDELMEELDQERENLSSEVDMYLEDLKQREFQLEQQPVEEVATALYIMYNTHTEGDHEEPEVYLEQAREKLQELDPSTDVEPYFDQLTTAYQETSGTSGERLKEVFDEARQLN